MKSFLLLAILSTVICVSVPASATTFHVDGSVPSSGDGTSWETAFKKIQEGIDKAFDGDTVLVAEGTYRENVNFKGKNIVLTGTNPLRQTVVENTVIDGNHTGPVVSFAGTEREDCVLAGFTIRNGKAEYGGGIYGGPNDSCTLATISNNIIRENSAESHGGGLAHCAGTIVNNTIILNSAGGAVAGRGAGVYCCDGVIENNLISRNSGAGDGGGLYGCRGIIQNNTIVNNSADWGGGLSSCGGIIRNCIIWGNTARATYSNQIISSDIPRFSCIQDWSSGGTGNISMDPLFVNAAGGDFRVGPSSPCTDAGISFYWRTWPQRDLDGNCRLVGDRVDMGCYEYGSSLDKDGDLLCDQDEEAVGTDPNSEDTDGDGLRDGLEVLRKSDPLNVTPQGLLHVPSHVRTIQGGLCLAGEGEEIVVAPGTYDESAEFLDVDVILRSSDPENPEIVASTIIDAGGEWGPIVSFSGKESPACVIAGFTVRNSKSYYGYGAVRGGSEKTRSLATIRNNVIAGNSGDWGGGVLYCNGSIEGNTVSGNSALYGGGLYGCDGVIRNNTITGNSARHGGAFYACHGHIQDNIISDNSAEYDGGGFQWCSGTIEGNTVSANSAVEYGGGCFSCGGTIRGNIISGNTAAYGGGLSRCGATIQNNLIFGNSATDGGGLYRCDGTIENNTVYGNIASSRAGGLYECKGLIANCIIWGNVAATYFQLSGSSTPAYCCIEDWVEGGEGNIALDPLFLDPEGSDFHLATWSPCIDAGDPASPYFNEPEPNGERVDMGAYGNTAEATSRSADTDGDGLPDDWEILWFGSLEQDGWSDPDGDGIRNITEYRYGWDPTSPAETLAENLTKELGYQTIQTALMESEHGDEIVVQPGLYLETIRFGGKNVVLRSTAPEDPAVVATTIIDGNAMGPVVTFDGTESEACVLAGFTIRNGSADVGGGVRGGLPGNQTHAAIVNNVLTRNCARAAGGGIAWCDGLIQENVITENVGSAPDVWPGQGGGLWACNGIVENNVIAGNSAREGGGVSQCGGVLRNNTIWGNSSEGGGAGLFGCGGAIANCIIWANHGGTQISASSTPVYSCIEGWAGGGEGNISLSPHFVNPAAGDFHLKSWSPCIDAGDPTSPFSEEPEPNGGRIDMGAYGNTPGATSKSADADRDGLPDDWEVEFFGNLAQEAGGDPDGDFISNERECRWGSDPTSAPTTWFVDGSVTVPGDGRSWEGAFKTIQQGIDASSDGHAVVVAPGTYTENPRLNEKNMVLRSTNPLDWGVVSATAIQGGRMDSVVTFSGTEDERCVLMGFTIRYGTGEYGGGICGGSNTNATRATICYNILTENSPLRGGGGLAFCDGLIEGNLVTSNSVSGEYNNGGGLYGCDGMIQKNVIANNAAYSGGGVMGCGGIIRNNIITDNSAVRGGGGLARCDGTIENNTVYGNSAGEEGGALYLCEGIIRNSIIWGNTAPRGSQVSSSSDPTYSCIQGWTGGGVGNVLYYPYFVDTGQGDYHLKTWSPCIDAGDPSSPFSEEPQPNGKRVNMGSYGNTPEATPKSADKDKDGLPDDWELLLFKNLDQGPHDDADDDGVSNIEEYRLGTRPMRLTWYVDASVPSSGDGVSWQAAFKTIQEGVDAALSYDIVIVAEGAYLEQVKFRGENITLRSRDPLNRRVVLNTVIDASQLGPAVSFSGAENEKSALTGFTIKNGKGGFGGGICGGTPSSHNRSSILNNVIVGNSATQGGGLAYCDGLIQNNLVINNSATQGGGLYYCAGIIQNNTIYGNSASSGGGLYMCHGTVVNSIIWGNTTGAGAQIVYSLQSARPRFCCIEGWTGGGEGNIAKNPLFVDPDGPDNDSKTYADNDYHLRPDSPCVDAGTHTTLVPPNTDMDGEWRPFGEEIDIGADECVDADHDGLADYWEIDWFGTLWLEAEDDVDGDGLSNGEEFVRGTDPCERDSDGDGKSDGDEVFAGTDPRDAESLFRIVEIVYTPWGAAVMWSAVPMRSYRCYFSSGLRDWRTAGGIITAGPSDTFLSVFDWGSVTARTSYYKVEVLP